MDSKTLICRKCWNIPCTCGSNQKVEIDDLMLENIIKLNKKGYRTGGCCQGHRDCGYFDMYILIMGDTSSIIPPNGFKFKPRGFLRYGGYNNKLTDKDIENARIELNKWVDELPTRGDI